MMRLRVLIFVVFLSACHSETEDNLPLLLKFFDEHGKGDIGELLTKYENEVKGMIDEGNGDKDKDGDIVIQNPVSDKVLRSSRANINEKEDMKHENNPIHHDNVYNVSPIENPQEINADDKILERKLNSFGMFKENNAYGSQNTPLDYVANANSYEGAQSQDYNVQSNAQKGINIEQIAYPLENQGQSDPLEFVPTDQIRKFKEWTNLKSVAEIIDHEPHETNDTDTSKDTKDVNEMRATGAFKMLLLNVSLSDINDKAVVIKIPINISINNVAKESDNADSYKNRDKIKPSVRSNLVTPYRADAKDVALAKKFRNIIQKSRLEAQ